jgi:hypothetical protein
MSSLRFLFSVLVAVFAGIAAAHEPASKPRMPLVQEEVDMRRKAREDAQGETGMAVAPLAYPDTWFAQPRKLKIEDASLMMCGQMFATLARKEVLMSGRVVKKKITVTTSSVSSGEAFESFRRAIEAQGVVIVPIGTHILVLVDSADASK